MIIASMLPVIGIIVVGLRLYARFYITRAPGWDDFCVVLAVIFGIALSVLIMLGDQIYYNGYHVWVCQLMPRGSIVLLTCASGYPKIISCASSNQCVGCTDRVYASVVGCQDRHLAVLQTIVSGMVSQVCDCCL